MFYYLLSAYIYGYLIHLFSILEVPTTQDVVLSMILSLFWPVLMPAQILKRIYTL